MTISVRKAGQAVAKTIVSNSGKVQVGGGSNAAPAAAALKVLRPPRAVTAEEAHTIQPARESTKTTMMPWRGWFDRFLKDNLSQERYAKMRSIFFFMPDDIYDLQQSPMPNKKIPAADPKYTHMYRYPSPGSQEPASLPEFEEGDDPYDNGYFKTDTRRRYLSSELGNPNVEKLKLQLMDQKDPKVVEGTSVVLFILFCFIFVLGFCTSGVSSRTIGSQKNKPAATRLFLFGTSHACCCF